MKRDLIPQPKSRFLKVKCTECGNIQIIFSHSTSTIRCKICNKQLTEPTGGKARIFGEIIEILG